MGRQRLLVAAFGTVVLAAAGAALFLVLGEPPEPDQGSRETATATERPVEEDAPAAERRRHAGQEGSAALFGRLVRGKDRVPVAGESVRLDREAMPGWTATTDESGQFRFEHLPHGGPFTVSAVVADCAPVSLPGLALDRHEELDVGDLRLDRAVSVLIQVRTLDGSPVPDALVEAFAQAEVDWSGDWTKRLAQMATPPVAVASLRTDAKGEARFDALATGSWGFRASADGYSRGGRTSLQLDPEDDEGREPVTIRLWPGHRLTGRVVDQDDLPLPGAVVVAMKPNQAWSPLAAPLFHRATADQDGRYLLDGLPAGELSLQAARSGGIPAQIALLRVPDLSTFDVHLRLGGALQGTVTESGTGAPVPDVEVRATGWATNSQRVGTAVTDAEGHYVIDSMLEGIVNQVTVDRPGWVVVRKTGNPWQQIALPHGTTATHDIEIRKGAVVTGTVKGPDGPLAGAGITLHANGAAGWSSRSAKCDGAGRFRVEGLEEGRALVEVKAAGHTQRGFPAQWWAALNQGSLPEEWSLVIPAEGEVDKELLLVRGGVVEGVVHDPEGEPIAGAQVAALSSSGASAVKTADDGTFRVEGVAFDADVPLRASAKGRISATQQIRATPDQALTGIELTLRPEPTVRGTVTTPDGSVPKAALVRLTQVQKLDGNQPYNWQDPERRWDAIEPRAVRADGTYEIPLAIGSGQFVVRASAEGFADTESDPVTIDEALTEYQVDIALGTGEVLRGRVVDAATKAPIEGALVAAGTMHPLARTQPWMTQNVFPPLRAVTDSEGRFSIAASKKSQLDLRVQKYGYVEAKHTPKVPQEGEMEIALASALRIAGVVRLADGSPVGGAQVTYVGSAVQPYNTNQSIVTGDDGSFEIRDLPDGKYTLTVQPSWNGAVNIRTEEVAAVQAGTTDLAITVTPGLSIAGRVLGPDGEGMTNTWINAQRENDTNGNWRGGSTQANGDFEIVGLEEGTYTLHVSTQNGSRNQQVPGVAAGTQDLVIRLEQGLEIRGVLVDDQGSPVAGDSLFATPAATDGVQRPSVTSAMTQTSSDGSFVIVGLAPGDYVINRNGGGNAAHRNHVLQGGGRVAAGSTGVRLVLTAGAVIRGEVHAAGGGPVRGVKSMWVRARIAGQQGDKWASVDAEGRFEIAGLASDVDYELRTMGGGFRPASAGPFPGGTDGVRLEVEPGLTSSGRLVDSAGHGIAETSIMFRHPDTDDYAWGKTGEDGGFEISGLMEGEYGVTAWVQALDADGNRTGQQRNVELGRARAGATGLLFEVPDPE